MIEASCHCGQVRFQVATLPETITECNCSYCRRVGWRLAYYETGEVEFPAGLGRVAGYQHGDRTLTAHHCPTCGCMTHWQGRGEYAHRIGVNARLFLPEDVAKVKVRYIDGADTWASQDQPF